MILIYIGDNLYYSEAINLIVIDMDFTSTIIHHAANYIVVLIAIPTADSSCEGGIIGMYEVNPLLSEEPWTSNENVLFFYT